MAPIAELVEQARLLIELGDPSGAELLCRRALLSEPDNLDALRCLAQLQQAMADRENECGNLLAASGKASEAMAAFRRALECAPHFAAAWYNLGNCAASQNRLAEALEHFRRAIEQDPGFAWAHNNLAVVLRELGRLDKAAECCRRAVTLDPHFAEAHNNLALVLRDQGDGNAAEVSFRRALDLKPQLTEASSDLAALLARQGRIDEATACYQQALDRQPQRDVWRLEIISLCPSVFDNRRAIDRYRRELLEQLACFSERRPRLTSNDLVASEARPPFQLQFHGCDDRPIREAYACIFRPYFESAIPKGSAAGRPRIGFVVTSGHEAPFLRSMGGVIQRMNPERFELVVIGSQRGVESMRAELRNPSVRMLGAHPSFAAMAAAIRSAQLDVVYYWEVGTDSTNYFLPFLRLAPVQCTSWGIQVTSGIDTLDAYLSSALVEPPDAQQHYRERLVLANTLLSYQQRSALLADIKPRESFGIPPQHHVYLCAQQLAKIHPDFDAILAEILRRDRHGLVVLVKDRHDALSAQHLRRRFEIVMPDVVDRVQFLERQSRPDYLRLTSAADVLLDPVHFGGVNSSYDGFSLDQPIVTLPTRFQRGRYTLACYQKMDMSDCVASSAEQYVDIAVTVATDPARRANVVEKIRRASPALFDDVAAVREHERIFAELVERSRAARDPA